MVSRVCLIVLFFRSFPTSSSAVCLVDSTKFDRTAVEISDMSFVGFCSVDRMGQMDDPLLWISDAADNQRHNRDSYIGGDGQADIFCTAFYLHFAHDRQ